MAKIWKQNTPITPPFPSLLSENIIQTWCNFTHFNWTFYYKLEKNLAFYYADINQDESYDEQNIITEYHDEFYDEENIVAHTDIHLNEFYGEQWVLQHIFGVIETIPPLNNKTFYRKQIQFTSKSKK